MITKKDILERKFNRSLRGYDPVEVRYFLEMLADEFQRLRDRISKLEALEKELEQMEGQSVEDMLQKATEKAANIVMDAEKVASDALKSARSEKQKIETTVLQLKNERDKLIHAMEQIIATQKDLVNLLGGQDNTSQASEQSTDRFYLEDEES